MTSRERVLRTLEFRSPDRAPRDLWALPWVGQYQPQALESLRKRFPMDFAGCGVLGKSDRAKGEACRIGEYADEGGSVWHWGEEGGGGEVKVPAVADWSARATFPPPGEMIEGA